MLTKHSLESLRRIFPILTRRFVSSSKRNNDKMSVELSETIQKTKDAEKNWVSYGYEYESKEADRNAMHSIMFASVTMCLVVGGFFFAYMPDYSLRDWSQREAFLEIRRREEKGLPHIDPNFINPAKVCLPSDEQLENVNIII